MFTNRIDQGLATELEQFIAGASHSENRFEGVSWIPGVLRGERRGERRGDNVRAFADACVEVGSVLRKASNTTDPQEIILDARFARLAMRVLEQLNVRVQREIGAYDSDVLDDEAEFPGPKLRTHLEAFVAV